MRVLRYPFRYYLLPAIVLALLMIFICVPLDRGELCKSSSQVIYGRDGELLRAFLSTDEKWRMPVQIDEVSDYLKMALLVAEDRFFYYHPGVNPWAIARALYLNIEQGKTVSGGSTITMQVARMMGHRERNLWSKLVETVLALKLELLSSKEKILELYFNMAPYGGNLEGVGAASYYYFQKSPAELSLAQAALLTAIPNSPTLLTGKDVPEHVRRRQSMILRQLFKKRMVEKDEYLEAAGEEVVIETPGIPFSAPHFTDFIHQRYPHKSRILTTLDLNIQTRCEEILRTHLHRWRKVGITNGAVVAVDNTDHSIRALVGSYDFFDESHSGQVNGALAPRSPGSALKPVLYALGIDRGLITPCAVLPDVPVSYAGYAPENYDAKYHGVVTVKEALAHSLNVPAINLLARIGVSNFISFLRSAGFSTFDFGEADCGLSMIVGGCEVNLLELTNVYSALANGGILSPLRSFADQTNPGGVRIVSDGAAYIVSELLSEVSRPDLPLYWEFSLGRPKVAWKTGTSYGHRDAWSIGYTKGFTVGVWVGNFDGRGVPELTGARVAGPILFDILNAITQTAKDEWFSIPRSVWKRSVCAKSGMVPGEDCPDLVEELFLLGVSPNRKCDVHQVFYVDSATGCRLCKSDLHHRKYERRVLEVWPPEVATWLERNGYPIDRIPPTLPTSQQMMGGAGPIIRSPDPQCEYLFREGIPLEDQKISLDVSVANSVNQIFWFLDGRLVWSGPPDQVTFICPERGEHQLVCQDDHGRSTGMRLVIR